MKIRNGAILFISILLLGSVLLGSGCTDKGNNETGDSRVVKTGDTVQVDYTGKLENGTVFDTSIEEVAKQADIYVNGRTYAPLTFVAGAGQMIKGFDEGVIGMKVGEEKTITIPPERSLWRIQQIKDPGDSYKRVKSKRNSRKSGTHLEICTEISSK